MKTIGNIIWILTGGIVGAITWSLLGLFWFITIIGIPFARQCFKLAKLQLAPFGLEVRNQGTNPFGFIGNLIWLLVTGWELFLINILAAFFMAVTIVGIPFAIQALKLAKLSLMPFGKVVVTDNQKIYLNT